MHTTAIVIPIYKDAFADLELKSVRQAYTIFDTYDIFVIKPQSLNVDYVTRQFPRMRVESFADSYFDGYHGYNSLMLSAELYTRFAKYDYMLVYQTDAYVFSDRLQHFTEQRYDYVGAPWLVKKLYRLPLFAAYLKLKKKYHNKRGEPCRQNLYNKVGNGGLSLRRIEAFAQAAQKHRARIAFYLSHSNTPLYNEDVFWAIEVPEFNIPSAAEALKFAFDKYPDLCYAENGNDLPMGCHGWYKWKWRKFWTRFIV